MHQLREEAVYGEEPMRTIARYLLQVLADDGHDVTEPLFAMKRVQMCTKPIYAGSVAFAVLGFPWCNLPPQYAEITTALVARLEALYDTMANDSAWRRSAGATKARLTSSESRASCRVTTSSAARHLTMSCLTSCCRRSAATTSQS